MIQLITGLPGSGKTLFLVREIKKALKENRKVASNISIKDSRVKYSDNAFELLAGEDELLVLDELQRSINSRLWELLPVGIQDRLQQHRKFGLDIWGSVQNIKRLDVVARELVEKYFEVIKICGTTEKDRVFPKHPWGLFMVREFNVDDAGLKRRSVVGGLFGVRFFLLRKADYDFYNTFKPIGKEIEDFKKGFVQVSAWICPTCHHRKLLK